MTSKITTLKNFLKTYIVYPITKTKAVYDDDGNRLDNTLAQINSDLDDLIIYRDYEFSQTVSSGTIGERVAIYNITYLVSGYTPIAVFMHSLSGTGNANVFPAPTAGDILYIYIYRASANGGNISGKARVAYIKS